MSLQLLKFRHDLFHVRLQEKGLAIMSYKLAKSLRRPCILPDLLLRQMRLNRFLPDANFARGVGLRRSAWRPGVGPGCRLLRGCERLGPFNSYKIATERHLMFKICLITNFESLIAFLAFNSCKKVYLNIFGVYFCMSMSRTAPWAHPWYVPPRCSDLGLFCIPLIGPSSTSPRTGIQSAKTVL